MRAPSILVSGASIAGPAAASWLARAGWDVTVVERATDLRDEGQNVDVRGVGREVLRRMGLDDAAREHHTTETGQALLDADGRVPLCGGPPAEARPAAATCPARQFRAGTPA